MPAAVCLVGCGSDTSEGVVVSVEANGVGEILWSVDGERQPACVHKPGDPVSDTICVDSEFSDSPTVKLSAVPPADGSFVGWTYQPQEHAASASDGCAGMSFDVTWTPHPKSGTCIARFEDPTP